MTYLGRRYDVTFLAGLSSVRGRQLSVICHVEAILENFSN